MRTERRLKNAVPFKKFLAWYMKWVGITFGYIVAFLLIVLMVLLFIGKAVEQHENKVNLIRSGQYIEPDFQDSLQTKKPVR